MNKFFVKKKKAMTLIEVLVSLAIFAMIVVPLGILVTTSVRTNKKSENLQKYSLAAQKIIESIKAQHDADGSGNIELNITDTPQYMTQMGTTTDTSKYNLGYSITGADIGMGDNVKADITYQRKSDISYQPNEVTSTTYDATINITGTNTFTLSSASISNTYSSKGNIEIVSDDSTIKINNASDSSNIVTLNSITNAVKKVKIINSASNAVTISADNNSTGSDTILSMYTFKNDSSNGSINCSPESSNVRVYSNLQQITDGSNIKGVYDVHVNIYSWINGTKGAAYYDLISSINIYD
ncbi:prepilin-type N-terminal cleavage/methylation domain-containing protein [Clostridium sp. 19966]|uniref:type IV pilus modification PilV family protein n=1 Tax=Clostridium sp. 19966 TaxID=2768166 RepID=UPI0028DFAFE1|nr:prepilin-type N-terminal cleavage/methylation domain-containing protein [Clostridium sp. 19966]MDT8715480.1 prepilin-type N-terminal cleavage/methylation domain-containing protein [Clostridium sp. 19966]